MPKKEYHRRVSPIVRNGGRSRDIHRPRINAKNTPNPKTVNKAGGAFLWLLSARADATVQSRTEGMAK